MKNVVLITLVLFLNGIFLYPFLYSIVWAVILALILWPLHALLSSKINSVLISALVVCFLVILSVLILISPIIFKLYLESSNVLRNLKELNVEAYINIPSKINIFTFELEVSKSKIEEWMSSIADKILPLVTASLSKAVGFFWDSLVVMVILFFLLKDGDKFSKFLISILESLGLSKYGFHARISSIIRRVFYSTILVALIQALLSFIGFSLFSVKYSLFLAFLVFILSVTPIGAVLVYVPASVFISFSNPMAGIGVLIWHVVLVSGVDNFLRPLLLSKTLKIPDGLLLFSTLGGLSVFGFLGVFLAPIVLGLSYAIVNNVTLKSETLSDKI